MILSNTAHKYRLTTGSSSTVEVVCSYVDGTQTTFSTGEQLTSISAATTTDILSSPGAAVERKIKFLSIVNTGVSSNTVTLKKYNGSNDFIAFKGILASGEKIVYTDTSGFKNYNANGEEKISGSTGLPGDKGDDAGIKFEFDTTVTDSDPGAGKIRFNNASIGSVTKVFIDLTDGDGNNLTDFIDSFATSTSTIKGILFLKNQITEAIIILGVTAVTTATGYRKLDVTVISGFIPANGDIYRLYYSYTGNIGATGANVYLYIAYASDDSGADFTMTEDPELEYIAILKTTTEIISPSASDFTGLWKRYSNRYPVKTQITSSSNVTPVSTDDIVIITAQATGLTLKNPTGTFVDGQVLLIRIKDDGTPQSIILETDYRAFGQDFPTMTIADKTLYLTCIYNADDDLFDTTFVQEV